MGSPNSDETYATAIAVAMRDMFLKLDTFERHADEERKKLREYVEELLVNYRKDVTITTTAIQLRHADHEASHTAERIADAKERLTRQLRLNLWLTILTVLATINSVLASVLLVLWLIGIAR